MSGILQLPGGMGQAGGGGVPEPKEGVLACIFNVGADKVTVYCSSNHICVTGNGMIIVKEAFQNKPGLGVKRFGTIRMLGVPLITQELEQWPEWWERRHQLGAKNEGSI